MGIDKAIALTFIIHIFGHYYVNDNSNQCDKRHQNSHHIFHMSPDSFVVDFFSIVIADLPNDQSKEICHGYDKRKNIPIVNKLQVCSLGYI